MAVPFSNTKLRVPSGFRSLMWVLTKEVIRNGPPDVLTFSADFMDKLLHIRDNTGHDPTMQGAHAEDLFYNNYVCSQEPYQGQPSGPSSQPEPPTATLPAGEGTDNVAATSGTCEQEEIDIDLDDPGVEKAATMIQAQFRGHLVRRNE
ncbi:hypothetical protein ACOMHN_036515 [Nucella lapillus]